MRVKENYTNIHLVYMLYIIGFTHLLNEVYKVAQIYECHCITIYKVVSANNDAITFLTTNVTFQLLFVVNVILVSV